MVVGLVLAEMQKSSVERTRPPDGGYYVPPRPAGAGRSTQAARVRVHVIPKRLFIMSVTKQLSGLCIPLFVRRNDHPAPVTGDTAWAAAVAASFAASPPVLST